MIDEARKSNIPVSITPAATPALTRELLVRLKAHGVEALGLSLDGSNAERHDSIRGVPGTFDRTVQAIRWAQELEMQVQINTLAAAETADDLPVARGWGEAHALDPGHFATGPVYGRYD